MRNLAFALVFVVAACGGGKIDSHSDGVDAMDDVADDMVSVLKTVKDQKSAEAARGKLAPLDKKMEDILNQMQALGQPDPKVAVELAKVMEKVAKAREAVPPELQQYLD